MQKYTNWVTNTTGDIVGGASVTVYLYGTSTKATIYSDNGSTTTSNPLTSDSADGSFSFYAANARYTLSISKTGLTFDSTDTTDIVLFDQADGISVGNGSASAPTMSFASEATTGFYRTSTGTTWWSDRTSPRFGLSSGSVRAASDSTVLWTGTAGDATASGDTGFSRLGAARLALGNGSASDTTGQLDLTSLNVVSGGSTTISTGVGSVRMSTANAATNTAWIPIKYAGTTYYIPAYTTNAP